MPAARRHGVTHEAARHRARGAAARPAPRREQIVDAAVALVLRGARREADHGPGRRGGRPHAHGALPPLQGPRRAHGRRSSVASSWSATRPYPARDRGRTSCARWVLGGLDHLVPCAQVVQVVFAGGSSRWVHDAATFVRILDQAGFADDELAEMQVWIALSVGGYVMAEASRRQGPNTPEVYAALAHLEPEDADRMARAHPEDRPRLRPDARTVRRSAHPDGGGRALRSDVGTTDDGRHGGCSDDGGQVATGRVLRASRSSPASIVVASLNQAAFTSQTITGAVIYALTAGSSTRSRRRASSSPTRRRASSTSRRARSA